MTPWRKIILWVKRVLTLPSLNDTVLGRYSAFSRSLIKRCNLSASDLARVNFIGGIGCAINAYLYFCQLWLICIPTIANQKVQAQRMWLRSCELYWGHWVCIDAYFYFGLDLYIILGVNSSLLKRDCPQSPVEYRSGM